MGQKKRMYIIHAVLDSCLHLEMNLRNLVKKILFLFARSCADLWDEQIGCSLQGVRAQAKNGDKLFWEEKFHAANGKTQACTQGALLFFPFNFGRGQDFYSFFPVSQCVPQHVLIEPHFYPRCFGRSCPSFTYIGGPKGKNSILQNKTFYFGEPYQFQFFGVIGQSNWLVPKKQ